MQRLLSLKRGSELLKSHYNTTPSTQSICSKTLPSLSKTKPNHLITFPSAHQFHRFSSQFAPASHPWRPHKNFSVKIYGFFSNPVVVKELLQKSILLKTTWKGLVDGRVGFMRHQISNRSFKLNGHSRRWYSRQFSTLHPHDHPFQVTTSLCIVIQPLVAKEKILSTIEMACYYGNDAPSVDRKSWFQRQTPDNVVLGLILANVAVFMLWRFADQQFMLKHFTISVENFRSGRVHTLITSAFSHIDMVHLISNMIGLYFFGNSIGRVYGTEFVVKLYLAGAIVGSIFYLVHHAFMAPSSKNGQNPSRTPGLGASGAVNAIMLLDIFLFPKATLYLEFIIPVPAILLGIFIIGKDMVRILEGDSQISGSAHLGGAVVAAVTWALIRKRRF